MKEIYMKGLNNVGRLIKMTRLKRQLKIVFPVALIIAIALATFRHFKTEGNRDVSNSSTPVSHASAVLTTLDHKQHPSSANPENFALEKVSRPLLSWSDRYRAKSASHRAAMLQEGILLARQRRTKLAALIQNDPKAALDAVIPRGTRSKLPAEVSAELEILVSARAALEVLQCCLHPVGVEHDHADDFYRASVIGGREYRVHVYGSRLRDASLPATSLHGIAIDGHLAISDMRVRVLDSDEPLPPGSTPRSQDEIAVEADGKITMLASRDKLPAFQAAILQEEVNPITVAADAGSGASGVTGRPSQTWTHGDKKLLVIRVDFSDLTGTPINKFDSNAAITETYVSNVINGASGVRSFYQENSFRKTDILLAPSVADDSPDVTAVLRMPTTATSYATAGDNALLHLDARSLATAAGFNLNAYDRIAVVFSYLGDISGSKITYGGLGSIIGPNLWVNGAFDLRVVAHELGHNHGLHHSNLWQVSDANPVSSSGSSTEYGDPFDLMGTGNLSENHFSHWNKTLLQWIPDAAVTLAGVSGIYRIYRFDSSAADLNQPRALKIVHNGTRDYWIGYRRATSSSNADNGATVIWGYNSNQAGNLLDLTTSGASSADAPLPFNTTFNDAAAGIAIQPTARGGSGADEWIDVTVTLQPRLQWAVAGYLVNEQGGTALLSVTRTNNSNGAVSVSYATATGTATSGTDFTSTSGTLNWANGDSAPKTIAVPITVDALVEGTEAFTVTLSSPVGGVIVDPAATTVTIADPGSRDATFVADLISNKVNRTLVLPDGKIMIGGWFAWIQDASYAMYNYGRIARLLSNGSLDTSFNPGTGANGTVYALARQPDGKILIGGSFTSVNSVARGGIARLNADGSLDTGFATGAGANGTVYAILSQPDGKILVGGDFTSYNGTNREYLARLDSNGNLDAGFIGPDFGSTTGWRIKSLALQSDGKCLVGGLFYIGSPFKAGLCRIDTTGAIDSTFNDISEGAHLAANTSSLEHVEQIAIQPDGKILIVGTFTAYNNTSRGGFARLSSTGALDLGFAPQPNGNCYGLMLLPDSSILIGGAFTSISGTAATRIARITSAGAVDTAFAAAGGHGGTVMDFALQPDGNVVMAGDFASFQGAPAGPMWRFVPGLSGLPGVIQFASDAALGVEGTNASLNVTRVGGSLGSMSVGYSTVAGTATGGGTDFTNTSSTLTWADGDASVKTISVPITMDSLVDTPEGLIVNLGEPRIGGAILGERQKVNLILSTAYNSWNLSKFTQTELTDPLVSGDNADPDKDGLNNALEYALGRNPKTPDAVGSWSSATQNVAGTDYLTLTFRRRVPALDLNYSVQTQSALDSLGWSATAVEIGTPTSNGDGTENATFRDSTPANSVPKRFMRVKITHTP